MTTDTVTLFTDRTDLIPLWQEPLEKHGLRIRVAAPDELGKTSVRDSGVVFDASPDCFDEDDLLTAVGYVRAAGGVPVVHIDDGEIEEVVEEICQGLVSRGSDDVERLVSVMVRQLDQDRGRRFEFVTVSPRDNEVLAIMGDGRALLLTRPLSPADDSGDVVSITLADDASQVTLELASGASLELQAGALAAPAAAMGDIPIDGARLGARLRALRLEAGLTQAELARRTGIHRPNIARVEAGRHTPSLETLARLASAIGVPTTRVLSKD
ncbi:MAG: helix-turn-helix transcriptional regulator [Myxococcota bacterium]